MMVLPRAIAFARWEDSEAWERLKVTSAGKTIAGAKTKIGSKQCTNGK